MSKTIQVVLTDEGYQALLDYMAEEPGPGYRTVSACMADLASVGIQAVTGKKVALAGERWGGHRAGSGRKVANEEA